MNKMKNLVQEQEKMRERMDKKYLKIPPPIHAIPPYLTTRYGDKRRTAHVKQATIERLYYSQKCLCGICAEPISLESGKLIERRYKAHLDHDHLTGKIRGLLCGHCNLLLGFSQDDIKILKGAIDYLERTS